MHTNVQRPGPDFLQALTVSFSVSASTLLLQLVQTRIFSVVFWNHLVYFIISIALLGYGISGTWLAFGRHTRLARWLTMPTAACLFVVSTLFATLVSPQLGPGLSEIAVAPPRVALLLFTYAFAVLPYFFSGWMLGVVFRDHAERMHTLYLVDLVGAGLGCMAFLLLIQPLGGVALLALATAIGAVPVLVLEALKRRGLPAFIVTAVLLIGTFALDNRLNTIIVPEPGKAYTASFDLSGGDDRRFHFSEWNAISRIDVVSQERNPTYKRIFIDGDAWTYFDEARVWPPPSPEADRFHQIGIRAPYFFQSPEEVEDVLTIGSGGGIDVYVALQNGAERVDAVEINPTTYRIMREEFAEGAQNVMLRDGVQTFNEEGRSFVRRTDRRYDVIVMHGIDTFAAINSGAYVLSENYLYTVDAIKDYMRQLKPGGTLAITRWLHYAETPRLFAVCLQALKEIGVENPTECVVLHGNRAVGCTILVRMEPFSDGKVDEFGKYLQKHYGGSMFHPQMPGDEEFPEEDTIVRVASAYENGAEDALFAGLPYDISPVYDDSPFFFHFDRLSTLARVFDPQVFRDYIRGQWPSFTLFTLLFATLVAVVLFMFLPLAFTQTARVPHFATRLLYFSCLGVAFIFVEIALMQRFALLLGHPSRSLALVLAGLLISAGAGSFLAERFTPRLPWLLAGLAAALLLAAYAYPAIIEAGLGWSLPARGALTLALIVPLGILMGMPFPAGIRAVAAHAEAAVPWMWGVNGGTTVLGSILAIVIAIWGNFTLVFLLAAAAYLVAAGAWLRARAS